MTGPETQPLPDDLPRLEVEFTVEPFHEGSPGPHVSEAIAVVESTMAPVEAASVDVGPFGTTVSGPGAVTLSALHTALEAALRNGASRISLQVTAIDPGDYAPPA